MNTYQIKAFGITKDIVGGREAKVAMAGHTVGALRATLIEQFPKLQGLRSLYIAVNNDYAAEDRVLTATDEIALIPPVSGG